MRGVLPYTDSSALCFIINCIQFKDRYKIELAHFSLIISQFDSVSTAIDWLLDSLSGTVNIGRFITLSICCSIIISEKNEGNSDFLIHYLSKKYDFCEFAHLMQPFKQSIWFTPSLVFTFFIIGFLSAYYFC